MTVACILLDIEGTVAPLSFVRDVLFPLARRHLPTACAHLHADPEIAGALREVAAVEGLAVDDLDSIVRALLRWSDEDRKAGPLKTIQGRIWAGAFERNELIAPLYPDAVEAMRRWHREGLRLAIYSSGSVAAQKLYFGHSDHGDLTGLVEAWFDTAVGPKTVPNSYLTIAERLQLPPPDLHFLTDAAAEVEAATQAGVGAWWVQRAGDSAGAPSTVSTLTTFEGWSPD